MQKKSGSESESRCLQVLYALIMFAGVCRAMLVLRLPWLLNALCLLRNFLGVLFKRAQTISSRLLAVELELVQSFSQRHTTLISYPTPRIAGIQLRLVTWHESRTIEREDSAVLMTGKALLRLGGNVWCVKMNLGLSSPHVTGVDRVAKSWEGAASEWRPGCIAGSVRHSAGTEKSRDKMSNDSLKRPQNYSMESKGVIAQDK
jgi:hypothetical protein